MVLHDSYLCVLHQNFQLSWGDENYLDIKTNGVICPTGQELDSEIKLVPSGVYLIIFYLGMVI